MVSHLINHLCIGEAKIRKLVRTWANIIYIEWYIIDIIYIVLCQYDIKSSGYMVSLMFLLDIIF